MLERIIHSESDVAEGAAWLSEVEPKFAQAYSLTGPLPLRLRRKQGFEPLLNAIVSQQLSIAAADSIWNRLAAVQAISPQGFLALDEDSLRACGLSRPKIRYARALAESGLDFDALAELPTPEVITELVAIKGIGVWTAEIYAKFSLGRADVFAAGDLALQEAVRMLFELEARPTEKALRQMAEPWSPWRSVAARLLWAYYRVQKEREGIR